MTASPATTGHSGLTPGQWLRVLTLRHAYGPDGPVGNAYREYLREFIADSDGNLPLIHQVVHPATRELVTMEPPMRVHLNDLDRATAEVQARLLAEWAATDA